MERSQADVIFEDGGSREGEGSAELCTQWGFKNRPRAKGTIEMNMTGKYKHLRIYHSTGGGMEIEVNYRIAQAWSEGLPRRRG